MSYTIKAQAREKSNKGVARRLRVAGFIPAVIYGSNKDPKNIAVTKYSMQMAAQQGNFYTTVQEIDLDGKVEKVLLRELQRDPLSNQVVHADFLRFDPKRKVKVNVRVIVTDEALSPGIKKGGVLSLVRNEVSLLCRADNIPNTVEISMAGVDVGHSVHFSAITLPEGAENADHSGRDFTVATVLSTRSSTLSEMGEEGEGEGEESTEETSAE